VHVTSRRLTPDTLAFLAYFALAALFYAPILAGLRVFPAGDFTEFFLPFSIFQRGEWLAGRLPLWNPFTYAGHPFLADVQAAVFYPVSNLLLALTLPWDSPAARLYWLQVEAVLHVALAGCFTYALARDLLQNRRAAFLAGGVFAFSGYLTGYPPLQLAVLRTAIWLPLILWLLLRAFRAPARWREWVAAALAYAVAFLAGHPQTFLFLSYAVAGWIATLSATLVRDLRSHRSSSSRYASDSNVILSGSTTQLSLQRVSSEESLVLPQDSSLEVRRDKICVANPLRVTKQIRNSCHGNQFPAGVYLARVAIFYLLFLGLSAAQLWPSIEFTTLSVRARVDYAFVSGGFPLRDTWQMLLPGIVSLFSPLYVGLAALGLAGLGGFTGSRLLPINSVQRFQPYFILLALLALGVSYGNHGFLYPVFYRWAPGWALFRGQERAAYLVAFGLSMLAGYGAAVLATFSARPRRGAGLIWAAIAAAGLIAAGLSLRPAGGDLPLRPLVFGALVLLAWAVLLWRNLGMSRGLNLLIGLVLIDLTITNIATNLAFSQPIPAAEATPLRATMLAHAQAAGGFPGRAFNDGVLPDNTGMLIGIEELTGSSPLRLARYAALLADFPRDRLWRLTGVSHVLSRQRDLYVPSERLAELPGSAGPAFLYRLATPHPRAWVVNTVRVAVDAQALPLLGDASLDPEQIALLPPRPPAGLEEGVLALPGANRVRLERLAPNRLRAHVESEHGGLLIVSENWLPGWRATEQRAGEATTRPVPVLRADLTLLAIPVKPGESAIELVYWPDSVRFGLAISGATLLLVGLAALINRKQRQIRPLCDRFGILRLRPGQKTAGAPLTLCVPSLCAIGMSRRRVCGALGIAAGALALAAVGIILSLAPWRETAGDEPPAIATLRARYTAGWPADGFKAAWLTWPSDAISTTRAPGALIGPDTQRLVIALPATEIPAADAWMAEIAQEYQLLTEARADDWRVRVYDRPPARLPAVDVPFAAGWRLTEAAIPVTEWVGGDVVPITLRWEGPAAALNGHETLTLQLLDARGKLVAQADQPFGAAELAAPLTRHRLVLPRFLDPGPHRLIAAIYDPAKPGAPRLLTTAGADHVELASRPAR
jgi:hypothetical protein